MRHLKCLACQTCLRSADSEADAVGDLCPVCGSLLEPVGDLAEIVGYRVIETLGSMSNRGASGAGELIADGVGEVIARRELKHTRIRLEIEGCLADSVGPQVQAAPGMGDDHP
jgi:glutamate synthase domain-containing protein 1